MKLTPYLTHSYLIPAFALMSLPLAHAQISFDDGLPVTATGHLLTNWDTDTVPTTGDTITIGSAFTVDWDLNGNMPSSCNTDRRRHTIHHQHWSPTRQWGRYHWSPQRGELTAATTGRFYDMNNATVTFQDGAQFTPSNGRTREPTYL